MIIIRVKPLLGDDFSSDAGPSGVVEHGRRSEEPRDIGSGTVGGGRVVDDGDGALLGENPILRLGSAHRALEEGILRNHIPRIAGFYMGDGQHPRMARVEIAPNDRLQPLHHVRQHGDRVDAILRFGCMRALAVNGNLEFVDRAGDATLTYEYGPNRSGCIVRAEKRLDIVQHTRVQHLHGTRGALRGSTTFLCRLEDDLDGTRQ